MSLTPQGFVSQSRSNGRLPIGDVYTINYLSVSLEVRHDRHVTSQNPTLHYRSISVELN